MRYVLASYFFVRYASSMCMRCDVLLANQRWGELPGQLGEGLGRTGGWGHARGRVPGAVCVRGRNRVVVVYLGCIGYGDTVTRLVTINV